MCPSWVDHMLRDTAVYWEPPVRDGLGGYTWGDPVELLSKWQYKSKLVYSATGSEVLSNATVWVSTNVENGGYLWKGRISDIQTIFDPDPTFSLAPYSLEENIRSLASQIISVASVSSLVYDDIATMRVFLV